MVMAGPLKELENGVGGFRQWCRDHPNICGLLGAVLLVIGGWLFLNATSERAIGFAVLLAIAGAVVGAFGLLLLYEPIRHHVIAPANRTLGLILGFGALIVGGAIVYLAIRISSPFVAIIGSVVVILGLLALFATASSIGRQNRLLFVVGGLAMLALSVLLLTIAVGANVTALVGIVVGVLGIVGFKIGLGPFIDRDEDPARQRNDVAITAAAATVVGVLLLYMAPRSFDEPLLLGGLVLSFTGLTALGLSLARFDLNGVAAVIVTVVGLLAVVYGAVLVNGLISPIDLVLLVVVLLAAIGAWFVFRGEALVAVLLLGFVLAWVLADRTADEPESPVVSAERVIVGFGDSYTSGEGAPKFFPGTNVLGADGNQCRRAPTAYPYLVAERLEAELIFLACSGATTDALDGIDPDGVSLPVVPGNEDQLSRFDALHRDRLDDVTAVLVSIGGNDVGFDTIIQACLLPQSCASEDSGRTDRWFANVRQVGPQLTRTYQGLRERLGADVPIVAVQYPIIVRPDPDCGLAIDDDEIEFVAEFTAALNDEIRGAAAAAGINLFDSSDLFAGRLLCDDDPATNFIQLSPQDGPIGQRLLPTTWIHGSMHPRASGHRLIADGLVSESGPATGALDELLESIAAGGPANPEPEADGSTSPPDPDYEDLPDDEWIQQRLIETVRDLLLPVALLVLGGLVVALGVLGLRIPILAFLDPRPSEQQSV